jgi:hypothetical protein
MARVIPVQGKPAYRQKTEKRNREPMNMDLRLKRYAMLPKNSKIAPAVSLYVHSAICSCTLEIGPSPYDVAASICVISVLVIPRSLAAKELMTVIEPVRKFVIVTAMVTDLTNKYC